MTAACIHIVCKEGSRPAIDIDRPVHAARVFTGKSLEDVLRLLPLMFGVCGTAQAVAGVHAMRAAADVRPSPSVTAAHGALVRFEVAREHLWRILLDWPRFCEYRSNAATLGAMQALVSRAREALFASEAFVLAPAVELRRTEFDAVSADLLRTLKKDVLGVDAREWLTLDSVTSLHDYVESNDGAVPRLLAALLANGWQSACRSRPDRLPVLAAAAIEGILAYGSADEFVEAPAWGGRPRETSALTRQQQHPLIQAVAREFGVGLLTRALAAVVELADTPRAVADIIDGIEDAGISSERTADNTGLAQVEAARGLLVHRVVATDGVVDDYRVVAPTEWNFHASGSVAAGLADLSADCSGAAEQQADLFLTLMDPCVRWSLELH